MSEVRFYHLTRSTLEAVLPLLLEKCLARGWRAVVRGRDPGRIAALDTHLWTWRAESFLAHGAAGESDPSAHPIWLTVGEEMPNAPDTLFLIDGADPAPEDLARLDTTAVLFDGQDDAAVAAARAQWRKVVAAGLKAVYWAESGAGGWERRAESG